MMAMQFFQGQMQNQDHKIELIECQSKDIKKMMQRMLKETRKEKKHKRKKRERKYRKQRKLVAKSKDFEVKNTAMTDRSSSSRSSSSIDSSMIAVLAVTSSDYRK